MNQQEPISYLSASPKSSYENTLSGATADLKKVAAASNAIQVPDMKVSPVSIWSRGNTAQIKKGIHARFLEGNKKKFEKSLLDNAGYTSFSGTDTTATVLFKQGTPVILGEVQTLTYSLYAPMNPVYNLGDRKPSGFIRGPRTVAGTIIFTIFDRHTLISAFHKAYHKYNDSPCLDKDYLPDELPPFDIQITFLNEYGQSANLTIHDVRITTEGQTMSIEDMITENTMQYLASDITLMEPNVTKEP